jgi:hypothetical protein
MKPHVATSSAATAVHFLRAYPLQTHEMLFEAHNHAFRVLGGVPPPRGRQDRRGDLELLQLEHDKQRSEQLNCPAPLLSPSRAVASIEPVEGGSPIETLFAVCPFQYSACKSTTPPRANFALSRAK